MRRGSLSGHQRPGLPMGLAQLVLALLLSTVACLALQAGLAATGGPLPWGLRHSLAPKWRDSTFASVVARGSCAPASAASAWTCRRNRQHQASAARTACMSATDGDGDSLGASLPQQPQQQPQAAPAGGASRRSFMLSSAVMALAPLVLTRFAEPARAAPLTRVKLGSPIMTESVLLDLLPIKGNGAEVLRSVQAEIEKATILRTIYNTKGTDATSANVTIPTSVWDQVGKVAIKAQSLLDEKRRDLEPVFREVDSAEVQIRRAERGEEELDETRRALQVLAQAAEARDVPSVLDAQASALLHLSYMGDLLVPAFPFKVTMDEQYDSIPRLLGRATVDLTIRRDPSPEEVAATAATTAVPTAQPTIVGNVTMVVDGYSAPVTAGNFIDLCARGFYDDLPLTFNETEDTVGNSTLQTAIGGTYREGFVDPLTGNVRRLPLEILRSDPKRGNVPFYGAARNTRIFTKSPAVQTFRIPGAVASYHPPSDGNGGSSQFFWLTGQNLGSDGVFMDAASEALDGRYSIFAYILSHSNATQVAAQLAPAAANGGTFFVDRVTVTYGADNLVKTKAASFKELLLNKGPGSEEEE